MSVIQVLLSIAQALAEREAPKLLSWLEPKLPGSMGAFVNHVLGLAPVQDFLRAEEAKAATLAGSFAAKGLAELEQELLSHIHGSLGAFLATQVAKLGTAVFTPEQAAQLSLLVAAGKLDAVLSAALTDLGVAVYQAAGAPAVTK